jgi:copper(I)-binding protein
MLGAMRLPALVLAALAVPAIVAAQPAPSAAAAWIAVPAAGATTADVFVEVSNPTMYEIYVTAASSEAAASVELRAGGAAGAVVKEFPVPAFGSTAAAADAPHLRLVGLKKPLAAGDSVALTLTTDGGVTLKVTATVRQP